MLFGPFVDVTSLGIAAQVDDLDFASLAPLGGHDSLKHMEVGGVTDDEFNALFGE